MEVVVAVVLVVVVVKLVVGVKMVVVVVVYSCGGSGGSGSRGFFAVKTKGSIEQKMRGCAIEKKKVTVKNLKMPKR